MSSTPCCRSSTTAASPTPRAAPSTSATPSIIMTSNIGSEHLLDGATAEGEIKPDARALVMGELRGHFRPEFLNRVDDIVLFKPLGERQIERIVELQFDELRRRLAERRITVELTEAARELIAHQGYDPVYGARPLRRYISHEVETLVGRALLRGDVQDGATVRVDAQHGELVVTYDQPRGRDEERGRREHRPRADQTVDLPALRAHQPGAGGRRGPPHVRQLQAAAAVDRRRGRRRLRRGRRAGRPCPSSSTCGPPGAAPAAWSAPRWSRSPATWPEQIKLVKVDIDKNPQPGPAVRGPGRADAAGPRQGTRRSPGRRVPHPPTPCAGGSSSRWRAAASRPQEG